MTWHPPRRLPDTAPRARRKPEIEVHERDPETEDLRGKLAKAGCKLYRNWDSGASCALVLPGEPVGALVIQDYEPDELRSHTRKRCLTRAWRRLTDELAASRIARA